jgi:Flp pilus assembly pilin Flp
MTGSLRSFLRNKSGAAAVDYTLVVAGIAVATIAAVWATGGGIRTTLTTLSNFLSSN